MKKTGLLLLFIAQCVSGMAQTEFRRSCGTEILKKHLIAAIPGIEEKFDQTLQYNVAVSKTTSALKTTTTTAPVPVVFHIILTQSQITQLGGTSGIEQRVDSQLAVINRDFNRANGDSTLIPAAFKTVYGNADIHFGLPHIKPDGTGTPGYEIITTTSTGFEESGSVGSGMGFAGAKFVNNTTTAWDPSVYLNVWIINPLNNGSASNILGLTVPPSYATYNISGFTQNEVGIVINYGAFGVKASGITYFQSGITGGRTLTHELGHFFEVWHVWGDDNGLCPSNGGKDDGISDTPPQADATYGCPTYPLLDSCTKTGNGIMFMNFMDYVNDACMHLFTTQQSAVMHSMTIAGQESYNLTQHPEVFQWPSSVQNVSAVTDFNIFPNPATGIAYVSYPGTGKLNSIQVFDNTGRMVYQQTVADNNSEHIIDVSAYAKGMYFIRCNSDAGTSVKKLTVQ